MDEDKKVILRSYQTIWKYQRKIYHLDDIKLLVPVVVEDAMFFMAGVFITFLLTKLLPAIKLLPPVLTWIAFPFGLMTFLTKKKFDGKKPHRFFIGAVSYLIAPKMLCRFKPVDRLQRKIIQFTPAIMRQAQIVNVIDAQLRGQKKGRKKHV